MSLSRVRIIIRPRDVVRSVIRFRSNTIVTRLKAPSVELPVRCTLCCPRHHCLPNSELSFSALRRVAFRRPSLRAFCKLGLTFRTKEAKNSLPAMLGTTGRGTITLFLSEGVGCLRVPRVVRTYVRTRGGVTTPAIRRVLGARRRACRFVGGE